jgi:4-aminobutyrate aminotransferase
VRGKGLMLGIELVRSGTEEADASAAGRALEAARDQGLLVGKGGLRGNVLRIAPPLSLTPEEADEGADLLAVALKEATA